VVPEPKGSSPHLQQPAIVPYPESTESTPHTPNQSNQDQIWVHSSIYALVFRIVSFLMAFPSKPCALSLLSHSCHMHRPPHPPYLQLPNNIWGRVQFMKLLTVQLPLFFHYFILLLGPNIVLRTLFSDISVYALPLIRETKFHTHIKQLAELWFNSVINWYIKLTSSSRVLSKFSSKLIIHCRAHNSSPNVITLMWTR
jgi:hypothetical protein